MPDQTRVAAEQPPALQFIGIGKRFFDVPVLKGVSFDLPFGEALGLVGENGAGKSTLMNILGGNHQPTTGRMQLYGREYHPRNPSEATAAGVAFIHQELNLFTNLTIAENLFISNFPKWSPGLPLINRARIAERTKELLEQVGLDLPPDALVENLSAGERQLVEVAKALSADARILLFDEPTTSLTARETEHLFHLIERLRARRVSIIYISHILNDVLRLCDRVVILRDGEVVGSGRSNEVTMDRMITLMVGRSISQLYPPRRHGPSREPVLEARGVSQQGIVEEITFDLHKGEVLGISGLMGSGRSELARILFGLDSYERGEIRLHGRPVTRKTPRDRIRRGMAFLTENRREDGLCLEAGIGDNIALVALRTFSGRVMRRIDVRRLGEALQRIREAVRLTASARNEQPVKTLSGGNQQKVVLSKWLVNRPSVVLLDEPTRGVDVGARHEVYNLINELAAGGAGVLVISSEIEELIGICDRILVMGNGEITDSLDRAEFDRERILRSALQEVEQ